MLSFREPTHDGQITFNSDLNSTFIFYVTHRTNENCDATSRTTRNDFQAAFLASSDAQNDARAHVDYTWREDEYGEEQKDHRAQVYYSVMVKRLVRSPSRPYPALTVARATCTWLIITRRPSLSARDRYRYLPLICSRTLTRHCWELIRW